MDLTLLCLSATLETLGYEYKPSFPKKKKKVLVAVTKSILSITTHTHKNTKKENKKTSTLRNIFSFGEIILESNLVSSPSG